MLIYQSLYTLKLSRISAAVFMFTLSSSKVVRERKTTENVSIKTSDKRVAKQSNIQNGQLNVIEHNKCCFSARRVNPKTPWN